MSVRATTWAWSRRLFPHLKLTLLAIANFADDSGYAFPGQARLAGMIGISERQVRNNISELARRGLLRVRIRPGPGDGRRHNAYQLPIEATGSPLPDGQPEVQRQATGSPLPVIRQ